MPRQTLVVLSPAGLLPAAALPVLRAAAQVVADETVPDDVVAALGAVRLDRAPEGAEVVLVTTDPQHSLAPHADVVAAPPPPGAALLGAVAVMDRLRTPGGCPWDAEQTHTSLLQYLVEECYELYQAIEDGSRADIREELGDVLLQVLFHARIAAEGPDPFTVDDVAADLVAKLVGRHPHVFGGSETVDTALIDSAQRQEHRWEELKKAEKNRGSSIDGVPLGQPAVALAAKLTARTARAGLPAALLPAGSGVGEQLFAVAAAARLAGIDPEAALRTAARRFADDVRTAEAAARAAEDDPATLDPAGWERHWPHR